MDLNCKKYTVISDKGLESRKYDNNFSKVINAYLQEKIDYKIILDKKRSIDNATNYYERAKISQDPKIKETINNNEKISKTLQEILTLIENDKLRRSGDFIKKAAEWDWIFNKDLYENVNDEIFARYQKDKDSFELLSLQTLVSNINRGYSKKKDGWEEFKTVKSNVKSEPLKEIVKELEIGLFGPRDDDKGDDEDDGDYHSANDESGRNDGDDKDRRDKRDKRDKRDDGGIGERVKLKSQCKINEKEFKEKYATGYIELDQIAKDLLYTTYEPKKAK